MGMVVNTVSVGSLLGFATHQESHSLYSVKYLLVLGCGSKTDESWTDEIWMVDICTVIYSRELKMASKWNTKPARTRICWILTLFYRGHWEIMRYLLCAGHIWFLAKWHLIQLHKRNFTERRNLQSWHRSEWNKKRAKEKGGVLGA